MSGDLTHTSTSPAYCGRCGYDVRTLPTGTCPECGSDLDKVGRRTRPRRINTPLNRAIVFVLLFAAFAFYAHGPLVKSLPQTAEERVAFLAMVAEDGQQFSTVFQLKFKAAESMFRDKPTCSASGRVTVDGSMPWQADRLHSFGASNIAASKPAGEVLEIDWSEHREFDREFIAVAFATVGMERGAAYSRADHLLDHLEAYLTRRTATAAKSPPSGRWSLMSGSSSYEDPSGRTWTYTETFERLPKPSTAHHDWIAAGVLGAVFGVGLWLAVRRWSARGSV